MSKKIRAFKDMCQEDQIALLKGGCTEMMILRSVVSYDPERDSWNVRDSFSIAHYLFRLLIFNFIVLKMFKICY